LYVRLLNGVVASDAFSFLPGLLRLFVEASVPALPVVVLGFLLTYAGKRAHRALAFPRILTQLPEQVARRQASVDRQVGAMAGTADVTATEALGTNYARFWPRALGYVIDSAVGLGLFFTVAILFGVVDTLNWPVPDPMGDDGGEMSDAAAALLMILGYIAYGLYIVLPMSSRRMATPGMRAVGVVATDTRGQRLSFLRALGRFFASYLSIYTFGIGFVIQRFTKRRQTLHDLVAGTVVLKAPPTSS
jgi:uncharacterized RDD family membrane protein YckC